MFPFISASSIVSFAFIYSCTEDETNAYLPIHTLEHNFILHLVAEMRVQMYLDGADADGRNLSYIIWSDL